MKSLTDHLLTSAPMLDAWFVAGVRDAMAGIRPRDAYATLARVRARHGFAELAAPLLTPPDANHKLSGAVRPSYGLTLHHYVTRLDATPTDPRLVLNVCPFAGDCIRVCVLNNGNGRYDSVQRAWRWRTDLLAREPDAFARILAWELVAAVRKHGGGILFRPNVNSDVQWERVLPSLTSGAVLPQVLSYGYSKVPPAGDGWIDGAYRVAYSWNETSDAGAVRAFLMRGGAVAVVTERRKGDPVLSVFPFGTTASAADADVSDEWMLTSGAVVGDLSAKGEARKLIGVSRFVVGPSMPAATRRRRTITASAA